MRGVSTFSCIESPRARQTAQQLDKVEAPSLRRSIAWAKENKTEDCE